MRITLVAIACISLATPSFAGIKLIKTKKENYDVYLQGVDRWGCLTDCGGECATFCAVINCRTGKFTGKAKGCVDNESCRNQCYSNVNFFKDCSVRVECSKYTVSKKGAACYTASGCIEERNGDAA